MLRLLRLAALAASVLGLPVDQHQAVLDSLGIADPTALKRMQDTFNQNSKATTLEHLAAMRGVKLSKENDPHAHPHPTVLNWANKPIPKSPLPAPKKVRCR